MKNFLNSVKLSQKRTGIVTLVSCGMLLALEVVLGMFTLNASPILKIGFSFLPVAVTGMLFGPVAAGSVGALGDIISCIIHPMGPYFPGFTVDAFLSGFLYGVFLYKKRITLIRSVLTQTLNTVLISLLLTPLWLSVLYSRAFWAVLSARVVTNLLLLPIDILLLYGLAKAIEKEPLFHYDKQ